MHALTRKSTKFINGFLALILALGAVALTDINKAQAASVSRPAAEVGVSTTDWTSVCTGSCDLTGFTSTVKVVVWVANGYVRLQSTSGFGTALDGYPSANWTNGLSNEIGFTASQANANAALEGLQYKANGSGTYELKITVVDFQSGTASDASTGHFYEIINHGSDIDWELARCKAKYGPNATFGGSTSKSLPNATRSAVAADQCTNTNGGTRRTMNGLNGYLANITSLAEQTFLKDKLNVPAWIGGSDNTTEGIWQWNDGPEAGQVFYVQEIQSNVAITQADGSTLTRSYPTLSSKRTTNLIDGRQMYNYFSDGEPNGLNRAEQFAEFAYGSDYGAGKAWNDCQNTCGSRPYYLIEYGDDGGTSTAATTSFNVLIPVAPQVSSSAAPTRADASAAVIRGTVLTSAVTFTGSPTPTRTYTWQVTSSLSGTPTWTTISGATSATFTVTSSQVGRYIRSVVTGTNVASSVVGSSAATPIVELETLAAPDLNSSSDTGTSSTDDTTQDSTPTIDLTGLTDGATATVTATKASSSNVTCTTSAASVAGTASCTLGTLATGTWSITATQNLNDQTSAASSALTVVVESPPPAPTSSGPAPAPNVVPPVIVPTPKPTPSVRPTPAPTQSARPVPVQRPNPVSSPSPSVEPTQSGSSVGPTNLLPTVQPIVIPQKEVTFDSVKDIPSVLAEALRRPISIVDENSSAPKLPELAPKEIVALVNGQVVPMEISANQPRTGYVATGNGFGMNFATVAKTGSPIKLDNDGNLLLNGERKVTFGGYGFAPGSIIKLWLFSDPVSLSEVVADKYGKFSGQSTIPGNIPFGQHTVQLSGISKEGVIRTLSMGVKLIEPRAPISQTGKEVEASSMNWLPALALLPMASILWFVLARKRSKRKTA